MSIRGPRTLVPETDRKHNLDVQNENKTLIGFRDIVGLNACIAYNNL